MMVRVGFIGLGNMGAPMASCIAAKGFELTVYDTDTARAEALAAKIGAKAAASPKALGEASDVVVSMLPTGAIVKSAVLEGGLAEGLSEGAVIVDMTSSVPAVTCELVEALAPMGIGFIDAPVSGAVPRATDGTLSIMVGCADPKHLEIARPVLEAMGNRIYETGGPGTGDAMKALNNYVAAAGFAAASEAIILGKRYGLDPAKMVEIFNTSTGRNFSTEMTIPNEVVQARFASGFQLGLLAKDVHIAATLSTESGANLPLVAQTDKWWDSALSATEGTLDHTTAYRHWEEKAGS
ncbi:NAD(P)-dependent oxidoreductase [Vannielia sp.]|uniref:NAD(P)-dependent oxidoreductase n=1 Tax=Vannielia sp. TaxID=2813045 RepID=UPI003BA88E4C